MVEPRPQRLRKLVLRVGRVSAQMGHVILPDKGSSNQSLPYPNNFLLDNSSTRCKLKWFVTQIQAFAWI